MGKRGKGRDGNQWSKKGKGKDYRAQLVKISDHISFPLLLNMSDYAL